MATDQLPIDELDVIADAHRWDTRDGRIAMMRAAIEADRARAVPVKWEWRWKGTEGPWEELPEGHSRDAGAFEYRPLYTRPPAPEHPANLSIQAAGEREAFEQFFADSRRGKGQAALSKLLERMPGGDYVQDHTQRHWWTWQKARASLSTPASGEGWMPIESAPKDEQLIGLVDGKRRLISWGKTSHVPMYGWCLVDQGIEESELCSPTMAHRLPPSPTEPAAAMGGESSSQREQEGQ